MKLNTKRIVDIMNSLAEKTRKSQEFNCSWKLVTVFITHSTLAENYAHIEKENFVH